MGARLSVGAPWRIAMASAIGTSHIVSGVPCQDSAFHMTVTDALGEPVTILIVSDGAGSASMAQSGSTLVCETFARLVEDYITGGGHVQNISRALAARWIAGVIYRLSLRSRDDGQRLHDYAATLLAMVCGERATAFLQIGDGAMVVADGWTSAWRHVFWPQHGEFANTTNFVTSADALEVMEFLVTTEPILEIAAFSDGLENLVLHKARKSVHAPFFNSMFPSVRKSQVVGVDGELSRALKDYLSAPTINERTNDDKTLILASRK
jgi:hypothetical protein